MSDSGQRLAGDLPPYVFSETTAAGGEAGLDSPDYGATDTRAGSANRASPGGGSTGQGDGSSGGSGALPVDPHQAVDAVKGGGGQVMGWVQAHPLTAIGLGLVGGVLLGSRGGSHHHHHYGSFGSGGDDHGGHSGGSYGGHAAQGGIAGGLMRVAQQAGLMDQLTSFGDQAARAVNQRATAMLRDRVPGFDDHLAERQASPALTPATRAGQTLS